MINKSIYSLLQLKYSHTVDWPLWEEAWAKYPTLKKDCPLTQSMKAAAREAVVKKLRKQQPQINS